MSPERLAFGAKVRLLEKGKTKLVHTLSIDSRKVERGSVFWGLRGPHFDGSKFSAQAMDGGAAMIVAEQFSTFLRRKARSRGVALAQCVAGLEGLKQLAIDQRSLFRGTVIGLTGSNGKTGAKNLLRQLLGETQCWATPGNLNNEIGLPLSVLGLKENHRFLILEMGMNHAGEILSLARLARPHVGLILNVGDAHTGLLDGRTGVAKAKGELLQAMGSAGTAVLNGDDPYTRKMAGTFRGSSFCFGRNARADLRVSQIKDSAVRGLEARLIWGRQSAILKLRQGGEPALQQAMACFAVGLKIGLKPKAMLAVLKKYQPFALMRLEMKKQKGFNAILDSYNASPQSMEAALDYVSRSAPRGKRVAVLGTMLELGEDAARFHRWVGKVARQKGFHRLAAMGEYAEEFAKGFGKGAQVFKARARDEAATWVAQGLQARDWVLFKGSRSMAMEKVYQQLKLKMNKDN